jgi:hypothetical protein
MQIVNPGTPSSTQNKREVCLVTYKLAKAEHYQAHMSWLRLDNAYNSCYQKLPGMEMRSTDSGMSASFSLPFPPSVRITTETHAAYASRIAHAMHVSLMFATIALCP